jgi:tRNA(Ile)-lysidine synthase
MTDFYALFRAHLSAHLPQETHWGIALSGGVDSVVLLDLLARALNEPQGKQPALKAKGIELSALHVNHGLNPQAPVWAAHCAELCAKLCVPFTVMVVDCGLAEGGSVEALARAARYDAFARYGAQSGASAMLLAHHADDLAETQLLQILRGAGVKGLASMPAKRYANADVTQLIWRPLLPFTRAQIVAYAHERGLTWVEDDSNQNRRFTRNALRHDVMPHIAQMWPHYRQHLARSALLCADSASVLEEVAQLDAANCADTNGLMQGLNLEACLRLSPPRQRLLLQFFLQQQGFSMPTPQALEDFRRQLNDSRAQTSPYLILQTQARAHQNHAAQKKATGVLIRYRNLVVAAPVDVLADQPLQEYLKLDGVGVYPLTQLGGALHISLAAPHEMGLPLSILQDTLHIKSRTGGELLAQKVGRKPLKTVMQDMGIPPVLRQYWPLIYDQQHTLLAVASGAMSCHHQALGGVKVAWLWTNFCEQERVNHA